MMRGQGRILEELDEIENELRHVRADLARIIRLLSPKHSLASIQILVGTPVPANGPSGPEGNTTMANLQLQDSEQVTLSVSEADAAGNPDAEALTWTSSDPTIVTVVAAADGLSAVAAAVGPLGTGIVVTASGPGVDATGAAVTLSGTLDIDVISGPPTTLSITAGTPTPKV